MLGMKLNEYCLCPLVASVSATGKSVEERLRPLEANSEAEILQHIGLDPCECVDLLQSLVCVM